MRTRSPSEPGAWVRIAGMTLLCGTAGFTPLLYGAVFGPALWAFTGCMGLLCALTAVFYWWRGTKHQAMHIRGPWDTLFRAALLCLGGFLLLIFFSSLALPLFGPDRYGGEAFEGIPADILPATVSIYPAATELGLTLLLAAVVPLLAARLLLWRRKHVYAVSAVLTLTAGCFAFYAFLNYLSGNHVSLHFEPGEFAGRAHGSFVNPNHLAAYLGLVLPLSLSLLFLRSRSWTRHGQQGFWNNFTALLNDISSRYWKILAGLAALCMGLAVVFSGSRMGITAAVTGVVVFLGLALIFRRRRSPGRWWAAMVVLGVLLLGAVALWVGLEPVMERFETLEPGIETRLALWRSSLEIVGDFPVFGTGLGTFPHIFPLYQAETLRGGYSFPHCEYIHLLVETGIPGASLLAIAFVCWIAGFFMKFLSVNVSLDRIYVAAGACAGVCSFLLNGVAELSMRIPANLFLASLLIGLATAALSGKVRRRREDPSSGEADTRDAYTFAESVGILTHPADSRNEGGGDLAS